MNRGSLFWGSIVILLGVVLLVGQFLPGINAWGIFWALALILLGLWFLLGRRFAGGKLETQSASIPLDDIQQARIHLHHGAGRLEVSAGAMPGALLEGSFVGGVEQKLERSGFGANLDLRTPSNMVFSAWPGMRADEGLSWNLRLTHEIPLQLELETGASETRLDLRDLRVTELWLKTGVSSSTITLPAQAGFTRVKVESGAARVELNVPEGVAGRIHVESGLADVQIDSSRFPAVSGGYETPGYESAANKVEIQVETGVAQVRIR